MLDRCGRDAGDICTITSSNVQAIEAGSRVIYTQAAGAAGLDSNVVLDMPGVSKDRLHVKAEGNGLIVEGDAEIPMPEGMEAEVEVVIRLRKKRA